MPIELWKIPFSNLGSIIVWEERLSLILVGFENGSIICYRIQTEKKSKEYTLFNEVVKHINCVTGMAVNPQSGHLYSIGKDNYLITTDLSKPTTVLKEIDFLEELTYMLNDKINKRLFISDGKGDIFILNYKEGPLQPLFQIKPSKPL